jgi:uncharacterized membrane protein YadS
VCAVVALVSTFTSEHYGGPQLLYALLIGLSLHFLLTNPNINSGLNLCATTRGCLVMAIAAAGVKTSFEDLLKLGWQPAFMLVIETAFICLFASIGVLVLGLGLNL